MFLESPFNASEEPAEDLEAALGEQLGQFVRAACGAFSSSTKRALRSDLVIYVKWLRRARAEGPAGKAGDRCRPFVDAMAELRAPATVRRYVTSIAIAHRCARAGEDGEEPAGAARAEAHAPAQGAPPGPGDGVDMAAAPAPAGGRRGQADRRPQPRAACCRLRRDAAQGGTDLPASP